MKMKWIEETRLISELKTNPKNPRRISKKDAQQLQTSLEKYGLCEPIIINTDNTIIGGHQRCKIWKKLGNKEITVKVPEERLSDLNADKLNIRLNKNQGKFDDDILANEWDIDVLLEIGFEIEDFGLESLSCVSEEKEEKPKKCLLTITFTTQEELEQAEVKIENLLLEYPDATYKVKIK